MSPFDWRTLLLAKHAQHVALIHFPIGLFIVAVAFDLIAHWKQRHDLANVAYFNLVVAALATIPAILTGIVAWQWQLEGQHIKGVLRFHLLSAMSASAIIWFTFWIHARARRRLPVFLPVWRIPVEGLGVFLLMLTGHLGGFLSGVNGPP